MLVLNQIFKIFLLIHNYFLRLIYVTKKTQVMEDFEKVAFSTHASSFFYPWVNTSTQAK